MANTCDRLISGLEVPIPLKVVAKAGRCNVVYLSGTVVKLGVKLEPVCRYVAHQLRRLLTIYHTLECSTYGYKVTGTPP